MSRDNARTPMQWSSEKNAGFTEGTPWMKVNPNYSEINVKDQQEQEDSVLHYYQKLIALRKSEEYKEVFTYGVFAPVYGEQESVMAFYRTLEEENQENGEKRVLVAANFGKEPVELQPEYKVSKVLLSNLPENQAGEKLVLAGCGVMVLECGI